MRAHPHLQNLILLAITLGACFVSAEVTLRAFFSDRIVLFPRYHAAVDYGDFRLRRLRPSTAFWHTSIDGRWQFVTNRQGFRDTRDYPHDKPAGQLRVLALGDSHTEGFEVRQEQTFAAVMERYLKERGVDAFVMNAGVSGFGTGEELAFLESEGLRYQPDVVVVGLFANDFEDNVKAGLYRIEHGELRIAKRAHQPGVRALAVLNAIPLVRLLSEHSYLYSLALNTTWDRAKRLLRRRADYRLSTEFAVATEQLSDAKKDLLAGLIRRMHEVCAARGIRLVILDVPAVGDTRHAFRSSVPDDLLDFLRGNSDAFLYSEAVLAPYLHLVPLHVPHGQLHISEFTHLVYGEAAGTTILGLLGQPDPLPPGAAIASTSFPVASPAR